MKEEQKLSEVNEQLRGVIIRMTKKDVQERKKPEFQNKITFT